MRGESSRRFRIPWRLRLNEKMAAREKFAFVLFRPQSAGNIGAAARALKNMGFDDLRLVAPGTLKSREAAAMAVQTANVFISGVTAREVNRANQAMV